MISRLLEKLFINKKFLESAEKIESRTAYGRLEGYTSIIINFLLFMVKLVTGLLTNSFALIADSIHTLSDSIGSVLIIISFHISAKPPDREHPYGHGRAETVTTLILSILLIITGFEFFKESVFKLKEDSHITINPLLIVVVVVSIILKEWMARFALYLGKRIKSDALIADAYHHRFDSITTFVVLISIVGAYFSISWIDMAASAVIALFIFYTGIDMLRKSINPLLGESPPPELLERIEKVALGVEGVLSIHDIVIHQYGTMLIISIHIEVSDVLSAGVVHTIGHEVEDRLVEDCDCYVTVHPDPINNNHPLYNTLKDTIEKIVAKDEQIVSFHDLRIVGEQSDFTALFDLKARCKRDIQTITAIKEQMTGTLQEQFPKASFIIKIEPAFAY